MPNFTEGMKTSGLMAQMFHYFSLFKKNVSCQRAQSSASWSAGKVVLRVTVLSRRSMAKVTDFYSAKMSPSATFLSFPRRGTLFCPPSLPKPFM